MFVGRHDAEDAAPDLNTSPFLHSFKRVPLRSGQDEWLVDWELQRFEAGEHDFGGRRAGACAGRDNRDLMMAAIEICEQYPRAERNHMETQPMLSQDDHVP